MKHASPVHSFFTRCSTKSIALIRFVLTPPKAVEGRLSSEASEIQNDISNLEKKLNYLETTNKNSKEHLDRLFRSSAGS